MLRTLGIIVLVSAIPTGCRCNQDRGGAGAQASASASSAVTEPRPSKPGQVTSQVTEAGERLLLPRPTLSKEPPSLTPPPAAERAEFGVLYRQLARGKERTATATEALLVDLKAWDETGKLVTDTTTRAQPLMFGQDVLPEPLRLKLAEQPIGSALHLWLPAEATLGWRLPGWPSTGVLRLELHLVGAMTQTTHTTERTLGARPDGGAFSFDPPASTGPPQDAKQGPGGLRYLWLASGPEGSQPEPTSTVTLRVTGYRVEGLVVTEIVRDQRTEMELAKAPKAIAHVVGQMVRGDSVRAWLSPELAKEVLPQAKSGAVVDVTLLDMK